MEIIEDYIAKRLESELTPEIRAAIERGDFEITCNFQPTADGRASEYKITITTIL